MYHKRAVTAIARYGIETRNADMTHHFTNSRFEAMQWELEVKTPTLRGEFWTKERIAKLARGNQSGEEVFDKLWGKDVPAWSCRDCWS